MESNELEKKINYIIANDNVEKFKELYIINHNLQNYFLTQSQENVIYVAIKNKAINILKHLFQNKINVNNKDKEGRTLLHLALEIGLCDIVESIFQNYSNDEIKLFKDNQGNNELHKWVIYHTCDKCLSYLLDHSQAKSSRYFSDKNIKDNSPLHQAVLENNLNAFRNLISNEYIKNNIIEKGEDGNTLLHFAAIHRNIELLDFILNLNKININSKNAKDESVLHLALKNDNFKIVEKLVDLKARVGSKTMRLANEVT